MTARAPNVHPRLAPIGAPDARARQAEPGKPTRRIEVVWHAEGAHSTERCFIDVFRRDDGAPMVVITSPLDAVVVSYDGPIDGVEDVDDEDEA
jgi:hypothetical protein